ncbi:MAG: ATP-binding cassette domain-containing protein [Desulfobacteraceae bacterium]|nr:ATP-binding cassette domain-containing protein [Desulfobacteraceae bacterium]MBC2719897.1 ATP-binding cassette domain-containing protein [Desulfobacteraceae bacterium]
MALIGMREVCWGFGDPPLLEKVMFQIAKGERVCLLGRNGVGKSTLLKLLAGEILPDSGDVWRQQGAAVAVLDQDVPTGFDGTIFDVIAEGLGPKGIALAEHNRICRQLETVDTPELVKRRDELQNRLNSDNGWELLRQVESILSRTLLDPGKKFADLSAGMKRRTLFASALAMQPDILLLDEPTNHLDIDSIIWMEEFILRNVTTLLFITHDRAFLKKIANRIIELDQGGLVSYNCNYATYLERREAFLEAEENRNRVFDKKLSKEEIWIRQGVKARRTRNEGRVRALKKMRAAFRVRRKQSGNVRMQVQEVEKTGKLVIEATNISFLYGATPIIRNFSTVIMRGDKVGIIGPNGVGKTTLLKILLKEIFPHKGRVRHGTHLQVAYFDQLRAQLDTHKTVQENIGEGNDFIIFNGQKRHVISYLQDFLFSPERCRTPVHVLSGGEKNRLLLAKLFTRPANVLVLDEPTNDLDAETLELLEKLLLEYQETLLLVSHDRAFLNNVVTSTLVFEGQGQVNEYAGGYDDWLIQRPQPKQERLPAKKSCNKHGPETSRPKERKLGFKEKRELKELPLKIDTFEAEQKELYAIMSDPMFYKKRKEEIASAQAHLTELEDEIKAAYLRWEALESLEKGSEADGDHFRHD